MDDDRDVVIHVLGDIAEEQAGEDGDAAKGDTDVVDDGVRVRERLLAGAHDAFPGRDVAVDAGQVEDVVDERGARQLGGLRPGGGVEDVVVDARRHDLDRDLLLHLAEEDVVVGRVADRAADDADGERERRNRRDQVVRADDRGDDRGWDNNAADPEPGDDEDAVDGVDVVDACCGERSAAGCHHARGDDHEPLVTAAEDREEPEHDTGTCEDGEADGETAESDANGVVAVDVEGLRGPEEEDGEEVGARDEGDDERQGEDAGVLLQARWEHGVLRTVDLPDAEASKEGGSKK